MTTFDERIARMERQIEQIQRTLNEVEQVLNNRKPRRKRRQTTCRCEAYAFPHRHGGGDCTPETRGEYDDPDMNRADACEDDWKGR